MNPEVKIEEPSIDDIRSVFHIVNACNECWDHPDEWQSVLLTGVQEIIGLSVAVLQLISTVDQGELPDLLPLAYQGWESPEHERTYLASLSDEDRAVLPNIEQALGPVIAEGSVSLSRPMIVPDKLWYQSDFYKRYVQPVGMDEWAVSFRLAPQLDSIVMIGGNRKLGADPVSIRTVKLLGILGEELTPLLGTRLSLKNQVSKAGLTPRQRQTLELLLDGLSEKQVATQLNLSTSTVHDYIVKLHKHFDVQSRGELLSYFIKRKPKNQ
jgi:DNA-binding CsgD family transcriptional regulator